jgi:hypothetical protein
MQAPFAGPATDRENRRALQFAACGPLENIAVCYACECRREQRRVRTGLRASLRWSVLRTDSPAMLGLVARRRTHCVRCAHCVQTVATSRLLKRAARAATSPALLGTSEAPSDLPARAFAATAEAFPTQATGLGLRGRRCPVRAISVATSSAGPGSARAPRALPCLTRRHCLSAVSAANAASSATRPRTEQRSAVGAQHRPPQHEHATGTACRDALTHPRGDQPRTAATGRQPATAPAKRCTCPRVASLAVEPLT